METTGVKTARVSVKDVVENYTLEAEVNTRAEAVRGITSGVVKTAEGTQVATFEYNNEGFSVNYESTEADTSAISSAVKTFINKVKNYKFTFEVTVA